VGQVDVVALHPESAPHHKSDPAAGADVPKLSRERKGRPIPPSRWSWFPPQDNRPDHELALIGTEGHGFAHGGTRSPTVTFTIVENWAPFQELRTLRQVSVGKAPLMRERLIEQLQRGIVIRSHVNVTNDNGRQP
jgi:hypothetical protein